MNWSARSGGEEHSNVRKSRSSAQTTLSSSHLGTSEPSPSDSLINNHLGILFETTFDLYQDTPPAASHTNRTAQALPNNKFTMHPHLHTEENKGTEQPAVFAIPALIIPTGCAEVIAILDECHAKGFMYKVFGNCSEAKHKVNMCLRAQRLERTRLNREAAKVKREHTKQIWKEIDENS